MSWIEWHLAVNPLPVVGTWVAAALLAWTARLGGRSRRPEIPDAGAALAPRQAG